MGQLGERESCCCGFRDLKGLVKNLDMHGLDAVRALRMCQSIPNHSSVGASCSLMLSNEEPGHQDPRDSHGLLKAAASSGTDWGGCSDDSAAVACAWLLAVGCCNDTGSSCLACAFCALCQ